MATPYIVPQVLVFQEFQLLPAAITDPLRAFIAGPNYQLVRYTDDDEKETGNLGAYDPDSETCYTWPGRVPGGVVDEDYTRLFVEDAFLQYFQDLANSGSAIFATFCDADVGGFKNRIRADSINWVTFEDHDRDSDLMNRDVQTGDQIRIAAVVDGEVVTFWSYVAGFLNDVEASSIDAARSDIDNVSSDTEAATISQVAGDINNVTAVGADASSYNGLETGDVVETYTIEVIQPSIDGDATTAILKVTSASGNDDVAEEVPSAYGSPTPIGSRGATATFDTVLTSSSSSGVPLVDSDSNDFAVGQRFELTVSQIFAATTATSGGDYTGPADTTYIVTVTRGGLYSDATKPQISISTTTGVDVSGPHDVTAAATALSVGSFGVTVATDGTGLAGGDRFYVDVLAESDGPIRTIILGHNLPNELLGTVDDETVVASSLSAACQVPPDLSVTLYIQKDAEIPQNRVGFAPIQNWDTSATEICVNSGVLLYDVSWVDDLGELLPLPVKVGTLFVHYRALQSVDCGQVETINDVSEVPDALGPISADNPLAMGVFKALENANGTPVKYAAVCADTLEGHLEVLEAISVRDDVYGLVPLTFDRSIQNAYAAHADAMSAPETGRWRITFVSTEGEDVKAIVTEDANGDALLATITDDPSTSGEQNTFVELSTPTGTTPTNLVSSGVLPGDILRAEYEGDGFGSQTFSEFVIDAVLSEDSVRLVSGPSSAVNEPSKIEIHRNLDATEIAEDIAVRGGSFANRRVYNIWPDFAESGGESLSGYYIAAAVAGLVSGVVPHQGLTNLEMAGFDSVPRTTELMSVSDLNTMAAAGTYIVTQDFNTGEVFARHELSTDPTDINTKELMVTKNVDSISYVYLRAMEPFIGISNITPSAKDQIYTELRSVGLFLISSNFVDRLGAQLIDSEIVSLERHPTLLDRLVAFINLTIPYPLNNIEVHLVI